MYRKILVPIMGTEPAEDGLRAALTLATRFPAQVEALLVQADPREVLLMLGTEAPAAVGQDLIDTAVAQARADAEAARARFRRLCADANVPEATAPDGRSPSALWRQCTGAVDQTVAVVGRFADLLVLPQRLAAVPGNWHAATMAALFGTGRPLLLAPVVFPDAVASVAVAWNGSVQAARAVAGALPFLTRARAVAIVVVDGDRVEEVAPDQIAAYLALHGVEAAVRPIRAGRDGAAATLLENVRALGADLLVMGGYGHGRFREWALGGMTRHVIAHADLPVLMAH